MHKQSSIAEILAWISWFISLTLIIVLWSMWGSNKSSHIKLSMRKPFTNWLEVKNLFENTTAYAFDELPTIEYKLWNVSWCSLPSFRKNSLPKNRSASCVCLFDVWTDFLNETKNTHLDISWDNRSHFASRSLSCMSRRAPWLIEDCGEDCFIHPMILCLYINVVVFILITGYLVLTRSSGWMARLFIVLLSVAFSAGFWAMGLKSNMIYIVIFLVIAFSLTYALLQEFVDYSQGGPLETVMRQPTSLMMHWPLRPLMRGSQETQQPITVKPPPIMICAWWAFLLIFPVYTIYIAISNTTRDIMGVTVFGSLGYIAALMLQRYYWTFWYIQPNQIVTYFTEKHTEEININWKMEYRSTYLFRDYPRVVLMFGTIVTGIFVGFLSYAHGFKNSPYMSSTAIFPLTIGLALAFGPIEIWNQSEFSAALKSGTIDGMYKQLGWMDAVQVLSLSLANIIFASVVISDST